MNFPNNRDSSSPPPNPYAELLEQFAASAGIPRENEHLINLPSTPARRMNPTMPQSPSVNQPPSQNPAVTTTTGRIPQDRFTWDFQSNQGFVPWNPPDSPAPPPPAGPLQTNSPASTRTRNPPSTPRARANTTTTSNPTPAQPTTPTPNPTTTTPSTGRNHQQHMLTRRTLTRPAERQARTDLEALIPAQHRHTSGTRDLTVARGAANYIRYLEARVTALEGRLNQQEEGDRDEFLEDLGSEVETLRGAVRELRGVVEGLRGLGRGREGGGAE